MKDMKAALGNNSKPDITHVRTAIEVYIARACEYGSAKYERGNYMRLPEGGDNVRDHFIRFGGYLRSVKSHVNKTLDSTERHLANDPELLDEDGMKAAAFAPDPDATEGAPVGASGLPHVAHASAALMMAIVQATMYGLLPEDPGQPWEQLELPLEQPTYDPAEAVLFAERLPHTTVDSTGLITVRPPPDYRPKCPHDLLIGRMCVVCPEGIASPAVDLVRDARRG